MIGNVLRSALSEIQSLCSLKTNPPSREAVEHPVERMMRLVRIHSQAPMDRHVDILFGDLTLAGQSVARMIAQADERCGRVIPPLKVLQRHEASVSLVRYFLHSMNLPGLRAECGVCTGLSSLIMCEFARAQDTSFDGAGMHLIDSFAGLSEPVAQDAVVGVPESMLPDSIKAGGFSMPIEHARRVFAEFPGLSIHQGWIPDVFDKLPESVWAFVHLDVDLYEPTRASLEYFCPRLVPGGVLICDDYSSPLFPGAACAWNEYCGQHGIQFVALPTGQSVILKS